MICLSNVDFLALEPFDLARYLAFDIFQVHKRKSADRAPAKMFSLNNVRVLLVSLLISSLFPHVLGSPAAVVRPVAPTERYVSTPSL